MGRLRLPGDVDSPVRIFILLALFGVAVPRGLAALARTVWAWLAPRAGGFQPLP